MPASAGGLYAHYMRIAGPSTLEVSMSFTVVIWAIFGGLATIYGPIAAVFVLFPLLEFVRFWPEYRTLIFAFVVLLILLYMPEGLIPGHGTKLKRNAPDVKSEMRRPENLPSLYRGIGLINRKQKVTDLSPLNPIIWGLIAETRYRIWISAFARPYD